MESLFSTKVTIIGLEKSTAKGISSEKEVDKTLLMHDPFSVVRKISRTVWFFIGTVGKVAGKVCELYRPSPIPKGGGLEIILKVTFSIPDSKRRVLHTYRYNRSKLCRFVCRRVRNRRST